MTLNGMTADRNQGGSSRFFSSRASENCWDAFGGRDFQYRSEISHFQQFEHTMAGVQDNETGSDYATPAGEERQQAQSGAIQDLNFCEIQNQSLALLMAERRSLEGSELFSRNHTARAFQDDCVSGILNIDHQHGFTPSFLSK